MDVWLALVIITLIISITVAWALWFTCRVLGKFMKQVEADMNRPFGSGYRPRWSENSPDHPPTNTPNERGVR